MPKLFGRNFTRRQLLNRVGDISQLMYARRAERREGFERGADLIDVFNASGLGFSVLPGRALDIASAHYKGQSLCFRSGPGDVGPAFYEPEGFKWGRGWFGGLVTSCGLDFVGHPEVDPEEENAEMPLHGRLSYIPAKNVGIEAGWEGADYVVRIRGQMRQAEVFAENLELSREISTVLGERSIHIRDRIENLAADRSPLMFVYHCNPGFPLLDEGTRLVLHSRQSTEWTADQPVGPEDYTVAKGPQPRAHDDVYVHRPRTDRQGAFTSACSTKSWDWDCIGSSSTARSPSSTTGSTSTRAPTSPALSRATAQCSAALGTASTAPCSTSSRARCASSTWKSAC